MTTGLSVSETIDVVRRYGAQIVGLGIIVARDRVTCMSRVERADAYLTRVATALVRRIGMSAMPRGRAPDRSRLAPFVTIEVRRGAAWSASRCRP